MQPLYIAAQSGGVPELKRVIVAYGNTIVMEENLEKSLNSIFGQALSQYQQKTAETPGPNVPQTDMKGLIAEASRQFDAGQQELRRGNWAGYGTAMQKVEQLLKELGTKVK